MKCDDRHWTSKNKCAPKNRMQTLDGGTNWACRRGLNGDRVSLFVDGDWAHARSGEFHKRSKEDLHHSLAYS